MRKTFYTLLTTALIGCSLTACSTVEFVAPKKQYSRINTIASPPVASTASSFYHTRGSKSVSSVALAAIRTPDHRYEIDSLQTIPDRKVSGSFKRFPVEFAITKTNRNSFGNLYLSSDNTSRKTVVVAFSRDEWGYKASTPLFFNTSTASSRFSVAAKPSNGFTAGIEFKLDLHPELTRLLHKD